MTIYIICGAVFLLLILCFVIVSQTCKSLQAENTELKLQMAKQNATIAELLRHAEEISLITQDKGKVENEIKKAKTDQELVDIANAIVSANNNRVHK